MFDTVLVVIWALLIWNELNNGVKEARRFNEMYRMVHSGELRGSEVEKG